MRAPIPEVIEKALDRGIPIPQPGGTFEVDRTIYKVTRQFPTELLCPIRKGK